MYKNGSAHAGRRAGDNEPAVRRFNRDYPQPYQAGIEHFIPFTEDINRIISQLNHH